MVNVGDGIEYVKMIDSLVDFLIRLNTELKSAAGDKAFIKGLVIAVFSMPKIKQNQILHPDLLEFIKGRFNNEEYSESERFH